MCNNNTCRLCKSLILSTAVTFAGGVLTINIPEGSYINCKRYCLAITQPIPEATTIGATVVVTIGDGTETYPLTTCSGAPVTAAALRTYGVYLVQVATTADGGSFRVLKGLSCAPAVDVLDALTGDAPAAADAGGGA
jgi:hypothetical protein